MKIAYLTGEYPRATDTFIQREVVALRHLGFDVLTCTIRRTGPEHLVGPEQRTEAARTFVVLDAILGIGAHLSALRQPARYFRAMALAWRSSPKGVRARIYQAIYFAEAVALAYHLRKSGVQHLHNHIAKASCTVAMLASDLSGIPYSFTMHGPDDFFEAVHWRLDEKIARARFVAAISDFARSQGMLYARRADWAKIHVVHCGIDPALYAGDRSGMGNRLLFVGRLAAVKGVPVLFEALTIARKTRPDLQLVLIGDGPERAALQAEAASLGEAVQFVGYKSQTEVAQVLTQTDLLVLPSFAEGVPVVLMEAMAAGLPVIATRIAGIPELVTDGVSGCLVAPGDAVALAQAILAVTAEPGRMAAMGAEGRAKVVSDFNIRTEVAWLGTLFRAYHQDQPQPGKRPGVIGADHGA
jgi:glycosyltransferase involved in cell wall biosynthesis